MSYSHLTINERESILELSASNHSIHMITLHLHRSPIPFPGNSDVVLAIILPMKLRKNILAIAKDVTSH